MKKKPIKIAYAALVLAACAFPVFTMPLFGETASTEKRELAAFPSLTKEGEGLNLAFFSELNTYFSEHFSFRSQLVTADSVVKAGLFGTSSEDQVIVGTDGWLYFAKTMDDYWGRNVLDDRDIARLARTVELMREYAQGQGAAFAFAVVPNKNTVYPEHMPYYTLKTPDPTNRERLAAVIGARPYVTDLTAALRAPGETLYHKRDSHWNALGALAGYNAVMDTLGLPHEDYADTPRSVRRIWDGDLDAMLDPGLGRKDDQVVLDTAWRYRYTSAFRSEEDITITTENDGGTGRLLMFRDSFGNAALPFFAQAFREAEFSRAVPYRLDRAAAGRTDAVVVEIVERSLPDLLTRAPVMPAPRRELPTGGAMDEGAAPRIETRTAYGFLHVYGEADRRSDGYTAVYLRAGGVCYEAFPIREEALLGEGEGAGFSAYLPPEAADGPIELLTAENGTVTVMGTIQPAPKAPGD